jgi:TBC1 domain family member 4
MRLNYLPDMKDFQLQLYQFSRLLKDLIPELFSWLDVNDVSPTLYAAPWFLTVFRFVLPIITVFNCF